MKKALTHSLWIFVGMLAIFLPVIIANSSDSFKPLFLYFISLPLFLGPLSAQLE